MKITQAFDAARAGAFVRRLNLDHWRLRAVFWVDADAWDLRRTVALKDVKLGGFPAELREDAAGVQTVTPFLPSDEDATADDWEALPQPRSAIYD